MNDLHKYLTTPDMPYNEAKVNKALEALTEDERVQLLQILQGA